MHKRTNTSCGSAMRPSNGRPFIDVFQKDNHMNAFHRIKKVSLAISLVLAAASFPAFGEEAEKDTTNEANAIAQAFGTFQDVNSGPSMFAMPGAGNRRAGGIGTLEANGN